MPNFLLDVVGLGPLPAPGGPNRISLIPLPFKSYRTRLHGGFQVNQVNLRERQKYVIHPGRSNRGGPVTCRPVPGKTAAPAPDPRVCPPQAPVRTRRWPRGCGSRATGPATAPGTPAAPGVPAPVPRNAQESPLGRRTGRCGAAPPARRQLVRERAKASRAHGMGAREKYRARLRPHTPLHHIGIEEIRRLGDGVAGGGDGGFRVQGQFVGHAADEFGLDQRFVALHVHHDVLLAPAGQVGHLGDAVGAGGMVLAGQHRAVAWARTASAMSA